MNSEPSCAAGNGLLGPCCGVRVALRRSHYAVVGSTAQQLRTVLGALGPVRGGRRFAAFTDWEVTWRYRHGEDRDRDGRSIREVAVDVSICITLPRWRPPRLASAELVRAWNVYARAVEAHEHGHARLAVEAGGAVSRSLLGLLWCPTREQLEEAAEATAQRVVAEVRAQEVRYDIETRHGESQGACLGPH
jgi:predicted secreted Zn-dependent protease